MRRRGKRRRRDGQATRIQRRRDGVCDVADAHRYYADKQMILLRWTKVVGSVR